MYSNFMFPDQYLFELSRKKHTHTDTHTHMDAHKDPDEYSERNYNKRPSVHM